MYTLKRPLPPQSSRPRFPEMTPHGSRFCHLREDGAANVRAFSKTDIVSIRNPFSLKYSSHSSLSLNIVLNVSRCLIVFHPKYTPLYTFILRTLTGTLSAVSLKMCVTCKETIVHYFISCQTYCQRQIFNLCSRLSHLFFWQDYEGAVIICILTQSLSWKHDTDIILSH